VTASREEVERIARLASLGVDESSLHELTKQIADILKYIAQLEAVEAEESSAPAHFGPASASLRPDRIDPIPMSLAPQEMAPEFEAGFYIVPKVEGVGEEE
jgi:aspartyl-tRNA(Asn)/glutamyl-tRNA(Gln) amidotransferase subunit C